MLRFECLLLAFNTSTRVVEVTKDCSAIYYAVSSNGVMSLGYWIKMLLFWTVMPLNSMGFIGRDISETLFVVVICLKVF